MAERGEAEGELRLSASITVDGEEALRKLLRQPLDFGCKPVVTRLPGDRYRVTVIGTEGTLRELADGEREIDFQPIPDVRAEVGEGDRYEGGRVVPRGFGRKETLQ
jgi:hypothetical protein